MTQRFDNKNRKNGFVFKLFVAGDEPHSSQAKANIKSLCETYLNGRHQIDIIDVFTCYDLAIENNIFLSPALIKESPGPRTVIFGNLSDTEEVVKALGLEVFSDEQ